MLRTALSLAVTLLAVEVAPAQAQACRVDLATLLSVHASRQFVSRSITLPPPPVQITEDVLVTHGGAATAIRTTATSCCDIPDVKLFASGIAGRAATMRLRDLLVEVRVGQLADCVVENDLTTPTGVRVLGTYEVTWYGRRNRRNRFTAVFADPGTVALPACGPEVQELIDGIRTFANELAADPDRIVCSTP